MGNWCSETFPLPLLRDLDQASMEAVVSLLAGLPLQPEEGDGVELMEAKSQLFLKYAIFFVISQVGNTFAINKLHLNSTFHTKNVL